MISSLYFKENTYMGRAKKKVIHVKPLPIASILANNPSNRQQPAQAPVVLQPQPKHVTHLEHYTEDFDTLHPHEQIKAFVAFLNAVKSRYEDNQRVQKETEDKTQDILHFIELSSNMNASRGFSMYQKISTVRRERRNCKSENDLLQPIYDFITANPIIDQLAQVQGKCRTTKEVVSRRRYNMKTDVINE